MACLLIGMLGYSPCSIQQVQLASRDAATGAQLVRGHDGQRGSGVRRHQLLDLAAARLEVSTAQAATSWIVVSFHGDTFGAINPRRAILNGPAAALDTVGEVLAERWSGKVGPTCARRGNSTT